MALPIDLRERMDRRESHPRPDGSRSEVRYYEMPQGATVATMDIEKDDGLPDDANALIQAADIQEDKRGTGKLLRVTALKFDTWTA